MMVFPKAPLMEAIRAPDRGAPRGSRRGARPTVCLMLALCLAWCLAWCLALPLAATSRAAENPGEPVPPGPGEAAGHLDPALAAEGPFAVVPFEALSVTRERPLFSPTRRPPPQPDAEPPAPPPPEPPAAPVSVPLTLSGTVIGAGGGYAILVDPGTGAAVRLRVGEAHGGWVLQSVDERSARLRNGDESAVLSLPSPEAGSSGPPSPAAPARAP